VRALVVDPDDTASATALRHAGIAADHAPDLDGADVAIAVNPYDCVAIERGLDSLGFVHRLRRLGWAVPVLFLSARDGVEHRLESFAHGGDDHLTKPFALPEFIARVRSLCRRAGVARPPILRHGDLELDSCRHRAARAGTPIALTAKEFAVLHLLASRSGEVVTRSALLDHCWDTASEPMSNVVDVLVRQLRRKIGDPALIHTVRGAGYRFEAV
jgi:DNA-binding response OmpR family regulator